MGEFSLGLVLNSTLLPRVLPAQAQAVGTAEGAVEFRGETGTAVSGWDGDRYALYEKDGVLALAWVTAWDSPADASEFAATYGKVLDRKYRVSVPVEGEDGKTKRVPVPSGEFAHEGWSGRRWTGTRDADSAVVVKGDRVLLLERVPADRLPAFLESMAKSEVRQDPADAVPVPGPVAAPSADVPPMPDAGR
jgi:hypothetical protein